MFISISIMLFARVMTKYVLSFLKNNSYSNICDLKCKIKLKVRKVKLSEQTGKVYK